MQKKLRMRIIFFIKQMDGLIVSLAYDTTDLSHFDPFIKKNIPVIFFDRVDENSHETSGTD